MGFPQLVSRDRGASGRTAQSEEFHRGSVVRASRRSRKECRIFS